MPNRTNNIYPIRGRSSNAPSKQELVSLLSAALASASEIPALANATGHRKPGPDRRSPGSQGRGPDRRMKPPGLTIPAPHGRIVVRGNNTTVINANQSFSIYIGTQLDSPGNMPMQQPPAAAPSPISSSTPEVLIKLACQGCEGQTLTLPDEKKGHPINSRLPSAVLKSLLCKISCKFHLFFTIPVQILICIQSVVFLNQINNLPMSGSGIYMCQNDCLPT